MQMSSRMPLAAYNSGPGDSEGPCTEREPAQPECTPTVAAHNSLRLQLLAPQARKPGQRVWAQHSESELELECAREREWMKQRT